VVFIGRRVLFEFLGGRKAGEIHSSDSVIGSGGEARKVIHLA
jgi:hypothetical protein